jgi:NADPH-dependent curcumin reductase CurA
MEGFVVLDYAKQFPAAIARMAGWLADGKLKFSEHVVEGLDQFPEAINMLFSGKNTGKLIVKV